MNNYKIFVARKKEALKKGNYDSPNSMLFDSLKLREKY